MNPEQLSKLIELFEKLDKAFLRRKLGRTVVFLLLLLLGISAILPNWGATPIWLAKMGQWLPYLPGVLLFFSYFFLKEKPAEPAATSPDPSLVPGAGIALKGALPYTERDGLLFAQLANTSILDLLRARVTDPQVPLAALMGASGVGKTSMLRAGLRPYLDDHGIPSLYCELFPEITWVRFQNILEKGLKDLQIPGLTDFETFRNPLPPDSREVAVILDSLEHLDPENEDHEEILQFLYSAVPQNKGNITWVAGFNPEFLPQWSTRGFPALETGHQPIHLLGLGLPRAAANFQILAQANGFQLSQPLLNYLIQKGSQFKYISPVFLGLVALKLKKRARDLAKTVLEIDDFEAKGGLRGMVEEDLATFFKRYRKRQRIAMAKCLLKLANPATGKPFLEGKTLQAINPDLEVDPQVLRQLAEGMAAPDTRLLEPVGSSGQVRKYRLPNKYFVHCLRKIAGAVEPGQETARLELKDTRAEFKLLFKRWIRSRSWRDLAPGKVLPRFNKYRNQLVDESQADERELFLFQSRVKARIFQVLTYLVPLAAVLGLLFFWQFQVRHSARQNLADWNLPADLYSQQRQLQQLTLEAPLSNTRWLRGPMTALSIESAALSAIDRLPRKLEKLRLKDTQLANLGSLASQTPLQALELTDNRQLKSLAGLAALPNLTRLGISGCLRLSDFSALESQKNLQELHIQGPIGVRNLDGVRQCAELVFLSITGCDLDQLPPLRGHQNLKRLILKDSLSYNLARLKMMPALSELTLGSHHKLKNLNGLKSLDNLKHLELVENAELASLAPVDQLPALQSLTLDHNSKLNYYLELGNLVGLRVFATRRDHQLESVGQLNLPVGISALEISRCGMLQSLAGLAQFTGLKSLTLKNNVSLHDLGGLEQLTGLETLHLEGLPQVGKLPDLQNLSNLRQVSLINMPGLANLDGLTHQTALRTLILNNNENLVQIDAIKGFKNLEVLELMSNFRINHLPGLDTLNRLKQLRINSQPLINDWRALVSLRALLQLEISSHDHFNAVPPLPAALQQINFSDCKNLSDLSLLAQCTSVQKLDLRGTMVSQLKALKPLASLRELYLFNLDLESIAILPRGVVILGL